MIIIKTVYVNNILLNKDLVENFITTYSTKRIYNSTDEEDYFINKEVKFSDDIWNFIKYDSLERSPSIYKFDFHSIKSNYKYYIKVLILEKLIINKLSITTVKSFFNKLKRFIEFAIKKGITNPILIDLNLILDFFESISNTREEYKTAFKRYITELLQEIEHKECILYNKKIYNFLKTKDSLLLQAEREEGKTNIIPRNLFNNIVSLAIKDLENKDLDLSYRKIACMVVILSETGMRIGELIRLEVNKLKSINISEYITLNYLEFKTYKTIDCLDFRWTECAANEKLILAYNTLSNIYSHKRTSKYLYPSETTGNIITEDTLRNHLTKFFARHQTNLGFKNLSNDELNLIKTKKLTKSNKEIIGKELCCKLQDCNFIYYVSAHQFRVTVCTNLYNQGISLEWIRIHMNHLDEEMTVHYIREKELNQKNQLVMETLYERVDKNGELLETDPKKTTNINVVKELSNLEYKQYYDDINNFLQRNNLKIKKDLNEIINILSKTNTPLLEMEYGYCAQHALARVCARQEYISSLEDSYHIKPQLPNLLYLELTYNRFIEKGKIVNHNKKIAKKDNRYSLEYERENKALKNFINNRLIPELNLAKEEINKIGLDAFLSQYPNLINIANKIDTILNKEIVAWI